MGLVQPTCHDKAKQDQKRMNTVTVPFKLPDLFSGWAEGNGLAKATPSELTLELVVKDGVLGVLKTGIREIRVPQSEIASLRHHRGWFTDKLTISFNTLRTLADLPGGGTDRITLFVSRRDRPQATSLVQTLSASLQPPAA